MTAIPERLRTKNLEKREYIQYPRNPFVLFYEDEKVKIRSQYPALCYKEVRAEAKKRWEVLADKSYYNRLSELDKVRYEMENASRNEKTINVPETNKEREIRANKEQVDRLTRSGTPNDMLQAMLIIRISTTLSVGCIRDLYEKLCIKGPVDFHDLPPEIVNLLY